MLVQSGSTRLGPISNLGLVGFIFKFLSRCSVICKWLSNRYSLTTQSNTRKQRKPYDHIVYIIIDFIYCSLSIIISMLYNIGPKWLKRHSYSSAACLASTRTILNTCHIQWGISNLKHFLVRRIILPTRLVPQT